MLTLLRIFLIFILIVFVFGFIARIFMRRVFRKMHDKTNQHYRYKERSQDKKREGTVTLNDKKRREKKKFTKDDGEYIDYEDLDE